MRILFVNSNYGFFGGVESYIYKTAQSLKMAGWECFGLFEGKTDKTDGFCEPFDLCFFKSDYSISDALSKIQELGVNVAFVHKSSRPEIIEQVRSKFKTIIFIHDHDYYCLRHHKYYPIGRKNCHRRKGLLCLLCSGMLERGGAFKLRLINLNLFTNLFNQVKKCDRYMVLSDYMAQNLEINGFDVEKIVKVAPVCIANESPVNCSELLPTMLYAGQLIRGKGVDLLIEAASKIDIDFRLVIAGKGNDRAFLEKLVEEKGLEAKVEFAGWFSNAAQMYQRCDFVVVPSRWQEPYGLVGIEANSFGKPVVGFDVGGISEWLKPGQNGILVPEGDVGQLASAIKTLLEDDSLRSEMGDTARRMVKELYGEQKLIDSFTEIVSELEGI